MFRGGRPHFAKRTTASRRIAWRAAAAAYLLVGGIDPLLSAVADGERFRFVASVAAKSKSLNFKSLNLPASISSASSTTLKSTVTTPAAPAPAASTPAPAAIKATTSTTTATTASQPAKKDPNDANGDGIADSKQGKVTVDDANGDGIPDSKQGKATADDANGDGIPDSKQGGAKAVAPGGVKAGAPAEPPATIAEWIKRLNVPAPPPVVAPPAPPRSAVAPLPPFKDTVRNANGKVLAATPPAKAATGGATAANDAAQATASAAKASQAGEKKPPAKPVVGGHHARPPLPLPPLPPQGTYRPHEVVALGLTGDMLRHARNLGFTPKTHVPPGAAPPRVMTLLAPPDRKADEAQSLLRGVTMSETSIGYNRIYKLNPSGEGLRAVTPAQSGPCPSERCYGPTLIKWSPDLSACTSNLKIGVIDTFVDLSHPTFAGKPINGSVMRPEKERPVETAHGTGVLSVLAGSRRSGTPGLIPDAQFFSADIFYADADGSPMSDTESMLKALSLLDSFDIDILNMSVAGPRDPLVEEAIDKLVRRGIVVVAAAGNEGPSGPPSYPAAYRGVIAVTAVSKDLTGYRYATRGDFIDLAAPGVDIWTAVPGVKEGYQTGTSFAVPYATAVIAAQFSALPQKQKRTKETVIGALSLRDLGTPGRDAIFGRGLVSAPTSCRAQEPEVARNRTPQPSQKGEQEATLVPARVDAGTKSSLTGTGLSQPGWAPVSTFMAVPPPGSGNLGPAARR